MPFFGTETKEAADFSAASIESALIASGSGTGVRLRNRSPGATEIDHIPAGFEVFFAAVFFLGAFFAAFFAFLVPAFLAAFFAAFFFAT